MVLPYTVMIFQFCTQIIWWDKFSFWGTFPAFVSKFCTRMGKKVFWYLSRACKSSSWCSCSLLINEPWKCINGRGTSWKSVKFESLAKKLLLRIGKVWQDSSSFRSQENNVGNREYSEVAWFTWNPAAHWKFRVQFMLIRVLNHYYNFANDLKL